MVKKILIYTIILFVGYTIVSYVWEPKGLIAQATWQDNLIKAQDVIYEDHIFEFENVLVGSSMTARLVDDSLPAFYNLSFMGGNYFFGLELLLEKEYYPKRLFVESNFPGGNKGRNESVFEQLDHPFFKPARKYVPSMREIHQPFLLVGSRIEKSLVDRWVDFPDRNKFDGIFQSVSEPQVTGPWTMPVSDESLDESLNILKEILVKFEAKGTKVYFYEMPYHTVMYDAPSVVSKRIAVERNFRSPEYTFLPYTERGAYAPEDGLHLNGKDRYKYTAQFRHWADSLIRVEQVLENPKEIANLDSLDVKN